MNYKIILHVFNFCCLFFGLVAIHTIINDTVYDTIEYFGITIISKPNEIAFFGILISSNLLLDIAISLIVFSFFSEFILSFKPIMIIEKIGDK